LARTAVTVDKASGQHDAMLYRGERYEVVESLVVMAERVSERKMVPTLHYGKSSATESKVPVMHEVEICELAGGQLRRIHAHRRDNYTVTQFQATDCEGLKESRTIIGLPLLSDSTHDVVLSSK
jgi:hypothetical protein